MGFSRLTNALVIGENLGPKKVLDAHGCNLAIIELNHLNDIFHGRVSSLSAFRAAAYPVAAMATYERNNIQVQHPPQPSELNKQGQEVFVEDPSIPSQEDGDRVGHRDE